jgi:hypothetical protein
MVIVDFDTVRLYRDYVVVWFANVATHYLLGTRIEETKAKDLTKLCERANGYVSILRESRKEVAEMRKRKGKEVQERDVCEEVPLNLTPNDDRELFTLCRATSYICEAAQGKIDHIPLPPALSLEFSEHIRSFLPRVSQSSKRTESVGVALHVLGLAVLGAHIAMTYGPIGKDRETGYTYVNTPILSDVDFVKLHGMVKAVISSVVRGNGGRLPILCGVASTMVLNYGFKLKEVPQLVFESVRTSRSGNKVLLKAFESLDLTDLARTISRLRLAKPIYILTSRYPAADTREARLARSFVERLSKAVVVYYSTGDLQELYGTLRSLSSESAVNALRLTYGEVWEDAYRGLIRAEAL